MNTIQTSLTSVLRVKPVVELVWAELNAHPKSTGKQIAGRLKLEEKRVAASLHEMSLRGMVKSRKDAPRRLANGTMRSVNEWWCVYNKYERLPMVKKPSKKAIVQEYHAKHPLVPAVAPTSPDYCTTETVMAALAEMTTKNPKVTEYSTDEIHAHLAGAYGNFAVRRATARGSNLGELDVSVGTDANLTLKYSVAPTTVMPTPVPVAEARVKPELTEDDALRVLDSMPLSHALKMYKHLHAIFNHDRVA